MEAAPRVLGWKGLWITGSAGRSSGTEQKSCLPQVRGGVRVCTLGFFQSGELQVRGLNVMMHVKVPHLAGTQYCV